MGAEALQPRGNAGHTPGDLLPVCPLQTRVWLQSSRSEVSHVGPLNTTEFLFNQLQLASTETSHPGAPVSARHSSAWGGWREGASLAETRGKIPNAAQLHARAYNGKPLNQGKLSLCLCDIPCSAPGTPLVLSQPSGARKGELLIKSTLDPCTRVT